VVTPSPRRDTPGAAAPANRLPGRPRLVVSTGGKTPERSPESRGEERAFYLTHSVTVLGRAAEADLRLNDPGVSRRHAEIRLENGAFVVLDLGSTNGIRVNQVPVVRSVLRNSDRVELGSTTLIFRRDQD
jgi:pSer/pThr/pTyr-binding forkhead associated (FHA) protein